MAARRPRDLCAPCWFHSCSSCPWRLLVRGMSCDESHLIRVGFSASSATRCTGYRNVGKRSTNIRMVIPEPAAARRRNVFGDVQACPCMSMCLYWQWRGFNWKAASRMEDQVWRINGIRIKACKRKSEGWRLPSAPSNGERSNHMRMTSRVVMSTGAPPLYQRR